MDNSLKKVALNLSLLTKVNQFIFLMKLPKHKRVLLKQEMEPLKKFSKSQIIDFIQNLSDNSKEYENNTKENSLLLNHHLSEPFRCHLEKLLGDNTLTEKARLTLFSIFKSGKA